MIGHYLMFDRNCSQALDAYEEAFGACVRSIRRYGDMPARPGFSISQEDQGLILNACIEIDGAELMCADMSGPCACGNNQYVSVVLDDPKRAQRIWDVLRQGGDIFMELAPSFFADLHGSLRDRFGICWMLTVREHASD